MFTTAWDDLAEDARADFEALGWNRTTFNNNGPPPPCTSKRMRELHSKEISAALSLGFTEASWDHPDVQKLAGRGDSTTLPWDLRAARKRKGSARR